MGDDPSPGIKHRFEFGNVEDYIWTIGLVIGAFITIFALFSFILTIEHLYCLKKRNFIKTHHEPPQTILYSTFCSIFAMLSVLTTFSTFPVCTMHTCSYNLVGTFYFFLSLDFYILSKLCLYALFIGRLFNDHYHKIYHYPVTVLYILIIVIVIIVIVTGITNVTQIMTFGKSKEDILDIVSITVYILADFILSGFTLFLFFKPIYKQTRKNTVAYKYFIISCAETTSSVIYGTSLVIRFVKGWYHTTGIIGDSYLDVCSLIQMMDMWITLICIYYGFAKKKNDTCAHCALRCFIRVCCDRDTLWFDEEGYHGVESDDEFVQKFIDKYKNKHANAHKATIQSIISNKCETVQTEDMTYDTSLSFETEQL